MNIYGILDKIKKIERKICYLQSLIGNTGSGGSGVSADLQTAADDSAAFTALSNSQWGVFIITGQAPSIYAKDASGTTYKLTLPTY